METLPLPSPRRRFLPSEYMLWIKSLRRTESFDFLFFPIFLFFEKEGTETLDLLS